MKATGIVRRVDDLGRIVIPKEIRRTLKIREGAPSYTTFYICGAVQTSGHQYLHMMQKQRTVCIKQAEQGNLLRFIRRP